MRPARYALASLLAVLGVTIIAGTARADVLDTTTVFKEAQFRDSFAINVHPNYAGADLYQYYSPQIGGTGRTDATTWKAQMCASGIPYIRAGLFANPNQFGLAQEKDLYETCGIRMIAQLDINSVRTGLLALTNGNYDPGQIAAVELINEPGNDGTGQQAWAEAMAVHYYLQQNNINIPVVGPSPTNDTAARGSGDLTGLVDACNIHPYAGGKNPENTGVLPFNITRGRIMCPNGQPLWATEFGWWTFDTDGGLGQAPFTEGSQPGVTEKVQATYTLRQYAENFSVLGPNTKSAVYELLDEWGPEKTDKATQGDVMSTRWGLLRADFTPKPAYNAVKELLRWESETTTSYTPAPVNVTITSPDNTPVHAVVLARSTGRDRVLLWRPDSVYNQTTGQETPVTPVPVTLKVCRPDVTVAMYLDTEYPEDPATWTHKVGGSVPNVNGCRTWTFNLDGRLMIANPWY